jgi:hypothetical protein
MKKYTVLSVLALACFNMQAAELEGTGFAGYTANTVSKGFSIVAVPFSGFNTNSFAFTNLSLEALVLTNGLSIGDRLIAFDETSKNYSYYRLDASGWVPLQITDVTPDSTNRVINAPALSTFNKAQGYAFWLKTSNEVTTVYLQGIVNTNAAGVAIAAGPSFTLVGNAWPTALDLNTSAFTNNTWFFAGPPGRGDEVHVVNNGTYLKNVYHNGGWKKVVYTSSNTVYSAASDPIPAGSGMWYLRRGTSAQTLILK